MANKQRGEIRVKLCDKEYTLRPTFEAMCEMEDKLNLTMPDLVLQLQQANFKYKYIATILWCGIHGFQDDGFTDDLKPSFSEIGNLVRKHGITKLLSEGIEDMSNPVIQFVVRGLVGDEIAEEESKRGKPELQETKQEKTTLNESKDSDSN